MNNGFRMVTTLISLLLLLIVSVLLFYPMFSELYIIYTGPDQEIDFIFIIPLFSAYFLWIQRGRLKSLNLNKYDSPSSRTGLIVLLLGLFLYIFGKYTYILFIQGAAFICIIAASVLFLYGREAFKIAAVPILFLLLALPLPTPVYYTVSGSLKYFIASLTAKALSLINIPVFIEGNLLHLPSMSLLVHDTCSGIRTTMSLLAIAIGFAYLILKSWRYKIVFILLSLPLGIFVNILRVFIIGALSYLYNENIARAFHEYSFGFVTPVGIISIFLIGNIFRCREREDT